MIHDYRARDYAFFSGLATAFAPDLSPSNYLGIYEDGVTLNPPPAPTGNRRAPTIYGRWGYAYEGKPQASLDEGGYVVRQGCLVLAVRVELNGDLAFVKGPAGLWQAWCDHCATYNDADAGVAIFTESEDKNNGSQLGWVTYSLPLRFVLTA